MTLVEPFLGAGAVWLRSLSPSLLPPVAWMGGKRRLAGVVLGLLGIEDGSAPPAVLGDACWWAPVWRTVLDLETGAAVSALLRSWSNEEPRELWFRLREAGEPSDPAEWAASLLWLQARAASGAPVWWSDSGKTQGPGFNTGQLARDTRRADLVQRSRSTDPPLVASQTGHNTTLVQWAGSKVDGRGVPRDAGHKQLRSDGGKSGGIVHPGTVADRIDAIRREAFRWPPTIVHGGATELAAEWAPRLGSSARVYLDPPYQGATGYPATCPRAEVLAMAETWAAAGARVVVSEAVSLAEDLGRGWSAMRLGGTRKPEWVTTFGCCHRAALGPLFAQAINTGRATAPEPRKEE